MSSEVNNGDDLSPESSQDSQNPVEAIPDQIDEVAAGIEVQAESPFASETTAVPVEDVQTDTVITTQVFESPGPAAAAGHFEAPLPNMPFVNAVPPPTSAPQGMPMAPPPVTAPRAPSPFVLALTNLWFIASDLWRGRTAPAFARPETVVRQTGSKWANWFVPFLASSLMTALFSCFLLAGSMTAAIAMLQGYRLRTGAFALSFGQYVSMFLVVALTTFGFLALRSVALMLATRVTGVPADFSASATTVAVAQTLWWIPLWGVSLLWLVLPSGFTTFVTVITIVGVAMMVELVTYIGVTRLGAFKRSPLVPYVWFTVLAALIFAVVLSFVTEAAF